MSRKAKVATMLQRLLDRLAPVCDDDASWLDRRDGVGSSAPVAARLGLSGPTGLVDEAGERTLQH